MKIDKKMSAIFILMIVAMSLFYITSKMSPHYIYFYRPDCEDCQKFDIDKYVKRGQSIYKYDARSFVAEKEMDTLKRKHGFTLHEVPKLLYIEDGKLSVIY